MESNEQLYADLLEAQENRENPAFWTDGDDLLAEMDEHIERALKAI